MAVLEFNGYKVKEMSYKSNPNFKKEKNLFLNPKLKVENNVQDNKIEVDLYVKVGSLDDESMPFEVKCAVEGTFVYNADQDENNMGVDVFIRNNAVAILYPYIRSLVATLTTSSNEFPGYNMPTINVGEVLKEKN